MMVDIDKCREDFMQLVYDELSSDLTNDRANRIIGFYDNLPAVEAAPVVHGGWIDKVRTWECSVCHAQANRRLFSQNLSYCYNCGAKMEQKGYIGPLRKIKKRLTFKIEKLKHRSRSIVLDRRTICRLPPKTRRQNRKTKNKQIQSKAN